MKLLITSDIHNNIHKLKTVLNKHSNITVHLDAGDSQLTNNTLDSLSVISVKGNSDYNNDLPLERIFTFNDKSVLITHGHLLNVKRSYTLLLNRGSNYNICIFGHTHIPLNKTIGKTLYLNPGSLGYNNTYIIYENNKARIYTLYE